MSKSSTNLSEESGSPVASDLGRPTDKFMFGWNAISPLDGEPDNVIENEKPALNPETRNPSRENKKQTCWREHRKTQSVVAHDIRRQSRKEITRDTSKIKTIGRRNQKENVSQWEIRESVAW